MLPLATLPNLLYVLLILGLWFASLVIISPGTGVYEVLALLTLGGVVVGTTFTPVNLLALIPLLIGLGLFVGTLRASRREGLLLLGAATFFSLGSVYLFRSESGGAGVNPILGLVMSVLTVGFYWFALREVVATRRREPIHGPEGVVNKVAEARTDLDPRGTVFVAGERWSAVSEQPVRKGQKVRILAQKGLTLTVEPLEGQGEVDLELEGG